MAVQVTYYARVRSAVACKRPPEPLRVNRPSTRGAVCPEGCATVYNEEWRIELRARHDRAEAADSKRESSLVARWESSQTATGHSPDRPIETSAPLLRVQERDVLSGHDDVVDVGVGPGDTQVVEDGCVRSSQDASEQLCRLPLRASTDGSGVFEVRVSE